MMENNNKVIDYLADQMFYSGFGEIPRNALEKALADAVKNGQDKFQIVFDKKYGSDSVRALLNFKRSDQNLDMVFFNSFDLLLKKEGREETLQQNFSASYGNRYTLKEGYNLLDGRSVNKNFVRFDNDDRSNKENYKAWVYLDFKDTDKYGNFVVNKVPNYDLEKKIDEYPIKNMEYAQSRKKMLDAISKGDRYYVNMETSQGDKKVYLEAAPRYNSLNLYDEHMKPIRLSMKKEELSNGQSQDNKPEVGEREIKNAVSNKKESEDEKKEQKNKAAPEKTVKKSRVKGVS